MRIRPFVIWYKINNLRFFYNAVWSTRRIYCGKFRFRWLDHQKKKRTKHFSGVLSIHRFAIARASKSIVWIVPFLLDFVCVCVWLYCRKRKCFQCAILLICCCCCCYSSYCCWTFIALIFPRTHVAYTSSSFWHTNLLIFIYTFHTIRYLNKLSTFTSLQHQLH